MNYILTWKVQLYYYSVYYLKQVGQLPIAMSNTELTHKSLCLLNLTLLLI